MNVETAPPDAGVVVLSWPTPPRAPSRVLVPGVTAPTVADGRPPASGPAAASSGRTDVPGTKPNGNPVLLVSATQTREKDMLTTELGLAEWTAATAVIAGGMALLAVLLRTLVTRAR